MALRTPLKNLIFSEQFLDTIVLLGISKNGYVLLRA